MQPKRRNEPATQADKNRERLANNRNAFNNRKEQEIDNMPQEEIKEQLQRKGQPIFGTNQERIDRLKRANGLNVKQSGKKGNVLNNIEGIAKRREERRRKMEEEKLAKKEIKAENEANGRRVDIEFQQMISQYRQSQIPQESPHMPASNFRICVCVRKRPIFRKEEINGEIDAVSVSNPSVIVHEPKLRVDGITKYLENHNFVFDNAFGENEETRALYESSLKPLCSILLQKGTVTCFAYGQTGSGKTFTMKGLQEMVVNDLFDIVKNKCNFYVSFFEIYGGRCLDLLNRRAKLSVLEDGQGNVQISGLVEHEASSRNDVHQIIEYGNSVRTTHATASNEDSSRSHAICQILIRSGGNFVGRLRLVDLAGSERAQDCMSNNRQRRLEGAEINKSLLALKECIRALRSGPNAHIPYRGSKLTLVLRDSFAGSGDQKRVLMITCISPGHSSTDHSSNSLRYADRLKEQSQGNVVNQYQPKIDIVRQNSKEKQPDPKQAQQVQQPQRQRNQQKETPEKFRKSFQDIEYIHAHNEDEKMNEDMLDFHEKVETILEEEEELLETHVNAIKDDAQILTEEGELIAMAQGEGNGDYDIDAYVQRMEVLVKKKLEVYTNLYQKLIEFKRHLNDEEEFSHNMTRNLQQLRS